MRPLITTNQERREIRLKFEFLDDYFHYLKALRCLMGFKE